MKLGDMGAEIIKVEQPGKGDDTRTWGPPFVKGESAYFLAVNWNKKSLTLDIKSKEGKEIIRELIRRSDVVVENFGAGVMEKLGFGYKQVKKSIRKLFTVLYRVMGKPAVAVISPVTTSLFKAKRD